MLAGLLVGRLPVAGGEAAEANSSGKISGSAVAGASGITTNSPWNRVVMIGASATAGFTELEPLGGPKSARYSLSRYVDAALLFPHEPVRNLGSSLFFLHPELVGKKQIREAQEAGPTLVLGLDYLFWFCYGDGATDDDRLQRFEQGLKLLDELRGPLVIGDLPNASAAVEEMLTPDQIPTPRALARANERLKEWVAGRKQTVLVSLSDFMRRSQANEAITIHGKTLPAHSTRDLLQRDHLHPTERGCSLLALAMIDRLQAADPAQFAGAICWDSEALLARATQGTNSVPSRADFLPVQPPDPIR